MQDFRMDTFLAVCKFMNFTKAADYLNLTQPAVSQHIRYLSQSYGVDLFFMEGKRLLLTEAGKILQQAALNMKHDEQHMRERMLQTRIGLNWTANCYEILLLIGQGGIFRFWESTLHNGKIKLTGTKQL